MTDRLRRLDALFAERVLGRQPATVSNSAEQFYGDKTYCDGTCCALYKGPTGQAKCEACGGAYLPSYTRSLDAAWEGIAAIQKRDEDIGQVHVGFDISPFCEVIYGASTTAEFREDETDRAPHPAEALVLACLRAVGCSEEELS